MACTKEIRIFYPADPLGVVPGGVDTFIRGILKYAPSDLQFSLVGMTTEPRYRPHGKWVDCEIGKNRFKFFGAVAVSDAGSRGRMPLSLRYTTAVARNFSILSKGFAIFDFHRIEPALLFARDRRPKNAFFHQDMGVIKSENSDILWSRFPSTYFALERYIVNKLSSAWCVREEGVRAMRARCPYKADVINFVPTWVDTDVFKPVDDGVRNLRRLELACELDLSLDSAWIVSVGRLDRQKDPDLLLNAFKKLIDEGQKLSWLIIGDGVLRSELERKVGEYGLAGSVRFLGLKSAPQIADLLQAVDVFALSSAYEGMPMALLEALGVGVPVVTTDVGEVRQVVKDGVNGFVSKDRQVAQFSDALRTVLVRRAQLKGVPATQSIQKFVPTEVLGPIFENYRKISE